MRDIPSTAIERIGKKFGRLTVEGFAFYKKRLNSNSRDAYWNCLCECGKKALVMNSNLLSGSVSSCGCVQKERLTILHKNNIKLDATFRAVYKIYRNTARRQQREFLLSEDNFKEITQKPCSYCGCKPYYVKEKNGAVFYLGEKFVYNGIDRVDNSKGYTAENSTPCCRDCNVAKGTKTKEQFLEWAVRIAKHNI